jgi:hypothetical protein
VDQRGVSVLDLRIVLLVYNKINCRSSFWCLVMMLSCIVQFLVFGYVRDYFAHLPTSANHLQQILTLFSWCLQKAGTNCFRQQMQLLQESQWRTRLLNGGCSEPSYSTLSGTISLSTSRAASFDVGSSVCTAPSNLVPNVASMYVVQRLKAPVRGRWRRIWLSFSSLFWGFVRKVWLLCYNFFRWFFL